MRTTKHIVERLIRQTTTNSFSFLFFSISLIDDPSIQATTRVTEVPPAADAKGEFTEVQVMEEGEIFGPSVFLDRLARQWKQDPSSFRKPEFFRNSSSLTRGSTEILYSCPVHPNDTLLTKQRDQHSVRPLEVLQVPRPKLFCQLWCGQCRTLLRVCQTSTPRLLPGQIHARHEVLLPSSINHVQVSFREESWQIIPEMFQTAV